MRTLVVRGRIGHLSRVLAPDEALIVDSRAFLQPAQLVERKLMATLKNVYVPLSHARVTTLVEGRGRFSASSEQPAPGISCGFAAVSGTRAAVLSESCWGAFGGVFR
jgi:hypothetical protein